MCKFFLVVMFYALIVILNINKNHLHPKFQNVVSAINKLKSLLIIK